MNQKDFAQMKCEEAGENKPPGILLGAEAHVLFVKVSHITLCCLTTKFSVYHLFRHNLNSNGYENS
jgi:hypothetical protein